MRRIAGALLAVLVLAPAAGAATPRHQAGDPLAAVQAVLDQRAEAIRGGDRDAFLATVDPEASGAFRSAQARSFDGWRAVPLASYELAARLDDTGDLSAGAPGRGADQTFLPETRQTYRLRGFDDRDAIDSLWLTFVRRGERWYVASDDDLSDLGVDTARHLWDLGPVRVRSTEHFLVLSRPAQAERADALAELSEEAVTELGAHWSQPWAGRIPLVLPSSVEELELMLQSTFDLDNFVAFVVYGTTRDEGYRTTAPRIFIQDRNLSRYRPPFQLLTLVHELVHAATVPVAGPFVPAWVHEGVADWIARGRPSEGRPRGSDGVIPRDHEFTTGGGSAIVRAYEESRSLVSFLARTRGADAPAELMSVLGAVTVAPGSVDHWVDRAVRDVAQVGFAELQRKWAGSG